VGFEKEIREQSKQNKSEQHAIKERRQKILTRHERKSETNHELAI